MNFTLTIHHRLQNAPFPYLISPRYTLVDRLFIGIPGPRGEDYFDVFNEKICTTDIFEVYTIKLTEKNQTKPLYTNGNSTNLTFWLNMGVDAGKTYSKMSDGSIWRFGRLYSNLHVIGTNIIITPIQDS